jgi:CheY-like chemotaxis protein
VTAPSPQPGGNVGPLPQPPADAGDEAAQLRDQVRQAQRVKSRFLAIMSHELRTPLNAILGAAQLLDGTALGPDQSYLVEAVRDHGVALLGLIDNVLDMSHIESGELALVPAPFDLTDCVEGALATSAAAARAKGLAIAAIVDPALPAWREGDAMRLRQVLLGLLGNAIKFTTHGEVVLRVDAAGARHGVRLQVSDTGIGIDAQRLPHVFEPFAVGDESSTRPVGGAGLGLAIARELVRRMGGEISARSEPGRGSLFEAVVQLPLAPRREGVNPRRGQPVAFYETHDASAQALAATLARMGFDASRCIDGTALRQWLQPRAVAEGQVPTYWVLVCTDHPSALRVLETAADLIDPARVIGMTSEVCYEAEDARETMGLARSVIKPVLRSAIVSRMGAAESARGRAAHGAAAAAALPAGSGKPEEPATPIVLVVEDDPTNSLIVCSMLQMAGIAHAAAEDGRRALELLRSRSFDAVLMDWQMPDMDGLEVARCIRRGQAGETARHVPIIALTANAFPEDRASCLAAGMNDFLTKPVVAAKLVETLRHWMPSNEAQATTDST